MVKRCTACGETKDLSAFSPSGRYLRSSCKSCRSAASTARHYAERASLGLLPQAEWGERFLELIDDSGDCWLWMGYVKEKGRGEGYGQIGVAGQYMTAHRLSYALHNGDLPAGASICHHCDNPRCVNPAHLYAGDPATNGSDASRRGRIVSPPGQEHGGAKLTDDQVRAIRAAYAAGNITQRQLASRFSISQAQVWNLVNGKQWTHID